MPLTALYEIGKIVSKDKDDLDAVITTIKLSSNQTEQNNYNLKIIFNLKDGKVDISRDNLSEYKNGDAKYYLFCGNNSARGKQYYITRLAAKGMKYIFTNMFFDLKVKMEELSFTINNRLYEVVESLLVSPIYDHENKCIKLSNDIIHEELLEGDFTEEKLKRIIFGAKRNDIVGKNIQLLIPTIITADGEEIVLPLMQEYKEVVLSVLKGATATESTDYLTNKHCYICNKAVTSSSTYLSTFPRDAISKIFITDKKNYAINFDEKLYDKNYQFCSECRDYLLNAEKFIKDMLRIKIANVTTYVIPSFPIKNTDIDYENSIKIVKNCVEIAFNADTLKQFIASLGSELNFLSIKAPVNLNFLSYETDGNSFKVIKYLNDLPEYNFIKLTRTLSDEHEKFQNQIRYFNLNSIYRMIPLKFGKSGISSKRNVVLELYSSLLNSQKISRNQLFKYFTQALYCKYFNKENIFKNLMPTTENFDFAIFSFFYCYLILLNSLQKLNLFYEEATMHENALSSTNTQDKKQLFLQEQGFNEQQQALFYLGALIHQVGSAQFQANHRHKPILSKINYQGMSKNDIKRLYLDVMEKLVQYRKLFREQEDEHSKFKMLFDRHVTDWKLSDEENVFYLFSGYAYKMSINLKTNENQDVNIQNEENENE